MLSDSMASIPATLRATSVTIPVKMVKSRQYPDWSRRDEVLSCNEIRELDDETYVSGELSILHSAHAFHISEMRSTYDRAFASANQQMREGRRKDRSAEINRRILFNSQGDVPGNSDVSPAADTLATLLIADVLELSQYANAFGWPEKRAECGNVTQDVASKLLFPSLQSYGLKLHVNTKVDVPIRVVNPRNPLVARPTEDDDGLMSYDPVPDLHYSKQGFPRLLVEVDSSSNLQDLLRMLVHAAYYLKIGKCFGVNADKLFFVVVHVSKAWKATRYVMIEDSNIFWFYGSSFDFSNAHDCVLFSNELHNFARFLANDDFAIDVNRIPKVRSGRTVFSSKFVPPSDTGGHSRSGLGSRGGGAAGGSYQGGGGSDRGGSGSNQRGGGSNQRGGGSNLGGGASGGLNDNGGYDAAGERRFQNDELSFKVDELTCDEDLPRHIVQAKLIHDDELVIIKRPYSEIEALHELSFLRHLQSIYSPINHVVRCLGIYQAEDRRTCLVLPRYFCLAVPRVVKRIVLPRASDSERVVHLSRQLIEAVAFLHSHSIAHLDLKPQNIVYDDDTARLFLIDFGMSVHCKAGVGTLITTSCGTRQWAAPEIVFNDERRQRAYSPILADLWSCGKLLRYFADTIGHEDRWFMQVSARLMDDNPADRPLLDEFIDPDSGVTFGPCSPTAETSQGEDEPANEKLQLRAKRHRPDDFSPEPIRLTLPQQLFASISRNHPRSRAGTPSMSTDRGSSSTYSFATPPPSTTDTATVATPPPSPRETVIDDVPFRLADDTRDKAFGAADARGRTDEQMASLSGF